MSSLPTDRSFLHHRLSCIVESFNAPPPSMLELILNFARVIRLFSSGGHGLPPTLDHQAEFDKHWTSHTAALDNFLSGPTAVRAMLAELAPEVSAELHDKLEKAVLSCVRRAVESVAGLGRLRVVLDVTLVKEMVCDGDDEDNDEEEAMNFEFENLDLSDLP